MDGLKKTKQVSSYNCRPPEREWNSVHREC